MKLQPFIVKRAKGIKKITQDMKEQHKAELEKLKNEMTDSGNN